MMDRFLLQIADALCDGAGSGPLIRFDLCDLVARYALIERMPVSAGVDLALFQRIHRAGCQRGHADEHQRGQGDGDHRRQRAPAVLDQGAQGQPG